MSAVFIKKPEIGGSLFAPRQAHDALAVKLMIISAGHLKRVGNSELSRLSARPGLANSNCRG